MYNLIVNGVVCRAVSGFTQSTNDYTMTDNFSPSFEFSKGAVSFVIGLFEMIWTMTKGIFLFTFLHLTCFRNLAQFIATIYHT